MKLSFDTHIKAFGPSMRTGPRVGIELEYEDVQAHELPLTEMGKWYIDVDHSLRNGGIEFISKPLRPQELRTALEQVKHGLSKTPSAEATKRCGVHVHVNASDLKMRQVWCWAVYYQLVEAFLFKEFADGREENHFCVPGWANTNLQEWFYSDAVMLYRGTITTGGMLPHEHLNIMRNSKYSAMNLAALKKFGTLEFRQMRGTLNLQEVERWCKVLIELREASLQYKEPEDVLYEYEANGFSKLCSDIGLRQSNEVNPDDLTDCIDGAYIMVGHAPTNHQDLTWEIA